MLGCLILAAPLGLVSCTDASNGSGTKQVATNKPIPSLSWALTSPISSLDFASDPEIETTASVMSLVTEPLERLSAENTYTPLLATAVKQPDARTLQYTLREGVKFSDGAPLTAKDVAWSIQHYADPTAASATSLPALRSVTATGPLTVTVKLAEPNPIARPLLARNVYVMEAKTAQEHRDDLGTATGIPIGTGPYVVSSYTSQGAKLTRNPGYWGQKPLVEKVDFPIISDDNARRLALRAGSIDAGSVTDLKTLGSWRKVPGATAYTAPSSRSDFLGFDVTKAPFNDVHVRRAIAYATNKAGIAKAGFDNNVSTLDGMVPDYELSDIAGKEKAKKFLAGLPRYSFDVERAKAEMAQSAHPEGFSTTVLYIETTPWMRLAGQVLQQDLKPLGITVDLKAVTLNQWFTQFFRGKLQGMSIATHLNAQVNDPAGLLTYLVGTDGRYNFSHWSTDEVNRARSVILSSAPPSERWAAAQTILSAIADQVPYVPLFTEPVPLVLREGFVFAPKREIDLFDLASGNWIYNVRASK